MYICSVCKDTGLKVFNWIPECIQIPCNRCQFGKSLERERKSMGTKQPEKIFKLTLIKGGKV